MIVLSSGFDNPAVASARIFRACMQAMARPGRIETIADAIPTPELSPAAAALALTLCDHDTPVHLDPAIDTPELRGWLAFHTGSPLTGPRDCHFAFGTWTGLLPLDQFAIGTSDYPDRSATLIVESRALDPEGIRLTGPGIETEAFLSLPDSDTLRRNAAQFPLGLDFFFTCGSRLAALPRSTRIG